MSGRLASPKGWIEAAIADCVMPSGTRNPAREGPGTFRYVDVDALDNKAQAIAIPKLLSKSEAPSRARMLIKSGDVLFCLVRPYLKNIAVVPDELDGEVASTAYCVLRPRPGIESKYLFFQIVRDAFISAIPTYGNSPPSARDDEFLQRPVKIAPLPEQRRIVAMIEVLFSDLDAGVAALTRVKANLKRYRAAVLKAAVEGRLTADWRKAHPDVEPASKLLERILAERRAKWESEQLRKFAEKGKEPPKGWREKYDEPFTSEPPRESNLPVGWAWATFDQLCEEVTVGHVGPMKDEYRQEGIPFLRSQNVRPLRFDRTGLQFIPKPFDERLNKSRLFGGELLVVRSGVNVGDACEYPMTEARANCSDLVIARPSRFLKSTFGAIYIAAPTGQAALHLRKTGNAQPHFNIGAMRQSAIPVPSIGEQSEIVAEVDRRLSVVDAAEAQVEHALQRAARLRQAILKRAFEGKLVPQDPADEPAIALLERTKASSHGHREVIEPGDETRHIATKRRGRASA